MNIQKKMLELQSQLKKRKKSKNASKLSSGKSEVAKDLDSKKSGGETSEDQLSFKVKEEQTPASEMSQPQTRKQTVTPEVSQTGKDPENFSGHQRINKLLPSNTCVGNGENKKKNGSNLPHNKEKQKREKGISKTVSPKSDSKSVVSNKRGSVLVLFFSSKILGQVIYVSPSRSY